MLAGAYYFVYCWSLVRFGTHVSFQLQELKTVAKWPLNVFLIPKSVYHCDIGLCQQIIHTAPSYF